MLTSPLEERAFWDNPAHRLHLLANLLNHAEITWQSLSGACVKELLSPAHGKDVLSIGSDSWYSYMYKNGIRPSRLTCVNISSKELTFGAMKSFLTPDLNVDFVRMDAHRLDFSDRAFDFVFGTAVLHHLDLGRALPEIRRVLRPKGGIFFVEPLAFNPLAACIRGLTPSARTRSERPLGPREIAMIRAVFPHATFTYAQLVLVPAGIMSHFFCRTPVNWLTRAGHAADKWLSKNFPLLGPLSRKVVIAGRAD
jgi:SAM-dependent methyltransferase